MKVALHTLGCKLNYSETSAIGSQFISNGFKIVDEKELADVYVLNTCTVTENADRECRQIVRRFLKQNPEAFIIVTGCYAQLRPEEISSIKGVDAVLGSNEKFDVFNFVHSFQKNELACIFVSPVDGQNDFGHAHSSEADSRTRAYLKIQDGCDYKCTFCTIPLARGRSRSMSPEEVILEFRHLLDDDYKEIILTGVNVGDYGKSFNTDLFSLLSKLVEIEGEFRIRVSSIEPNLLSDEILELTARSEKLCKHFHIPLQSGSPKILRTMQRRYKVEDYEKLIQKINSTIPEAGIGVDVIVGFPGETDDDFLATHNFLRDLPISYLHVFTYSERPNTAANDMLHKVDLIDRKERNKILRILSDKKRNDFYNRMLNRDVDVLFEHENYNGMMKGFSSNYIRVTMPYRLELTNKFSQVQITGFDKSLCTGKIVDTKKAVDLFIS